MFNIDYRLIIIVFSAVILSGIVLSNSDSNDFDWTTGKWEVDQMDGSGITFYFDLESENSTIAGRHCFINQAAFDCADEDQVTLQNAALIDENTLELDFITQYSTGSEGENTGKIRLAIISPNTIKWNLVEVPSAVPPTPVPRHDVTFVRHVQ